MISRGRRTLRVLPISAAAALIVGTRLAAGSAAAFNAQTVDPGNGYAFTALYAPGSLTASPTGHDVALGWTAGTNGNGYAVLGVANGTSSDCTGASFAGIGSAAGTSYTDAGRYTPQGTWFCYQVETSYGPWTSVNANPVASARIGFVATGVQAINGGTAGTLDQGDQLVFTFNQPVDTTLGAPTGYVCSTNNSPYTIVLGTSVNSGACNATETAALGTLVGGTSNKNGRFAATWNWSNGDRTLTVTIGNHTAGSFPTLTGTWTFDPTTVTGNVLSAAGDFHVCDSNAGGGDCLPTVSGSY